MARLWYSRSDVGGYRYHQSREHCELFKNQDIEVHSCISSFYRPELQTKLYSSVHLSQIIVPPTPYAELMQCHFLYPKLLQLDIIVQQPDLLTRLERRKTNVWASITPEGIAQRAVSAAANLSLYRKVHLGKIVGVQLERVQCFIGGGAFGGVFGFDFFFHATSAVLAGASSLAGFGLAFECWDMLAV
jgi:hypothetical protein